MYRLGLDLGGTKLAAVLIDEDGRVFREAWMPHRVNDLDSLMRLLAEMSLSLQLGGLIDTGIVAGIGFSVAGWLDQARTGILNAANLGLKDVPLAGMIGAMFGDLPVTLANDGDATLWGERVLGSATGIDNAVLFSIGTGLGGAIIQNGNLVTGGFGLGGELGHIPVGGRDVCVCGGTGHLESLVSGRTLGAVAARLARSGTSPSLRRLSRRGRLLTSRELGIAAEEGDAAAINALAEASSALARAIQILIPVLDPEVVVIGGSVAEGVGAFIRPMIESEVERARFVPGLRPAPAIVVATLKGRAAVLGAASLA